MEEKRVVLGSEEFMRLVRGQEVEAEAPTGAWRIGERGKKPAAAAGRRAKREARPGKAAPRGGN